MDQAALEAEACVAAAFPLPALLFFAGAVFVALYLKRKHRLGLGALLQVMLGAARAEHDRVSRGAILLTLALPIALLLYLGAGC